MLLSYIVCESTERGLQPCWAQLRWRRPTNRRWVNGCRMAKEKGRNVSVWHMW